MSMRVSGLDGRVCKEYDAKSRVRRLRCFAAAAAALLSSFRAGRQVVDRLGDEIAAPYAQSTHAELKYCILVAYGLYASLC